MHSAAFPWWPIPLVAAAWVIACLGIGRMSGWAALAAEFRLEGDFEGQKWGWQSAAMRAMCRYGNCLTLGVNQRGLYMRVQPILRIGHAPLLVPWEQIQCASRKVMGIELVQLTLGREQQIPLLVRPATAERLRTAAGGRWPGAV